MSIDVIIQGGDYMEILDLVQVKGNVENLRMDEQEQIKENAQVIWDEFKHTDLFRKICHKIVLKGDIYKTMKRATTWLPVKVKGTVKFYSSNDGINKRKIDKIMNMYGIQENERIIVSVDQSLFKSFKESIVVTDKFIYGKKKDKSIKKIAIKDVEKVYSNKYTVQINHEIELKLKEISKEVRIYLQFILYMFNYGILDMNKENEIIADYSGRYTDKLEVMINKKVERSKAR